MDRKKPEAGGRLITFADAHGIDQVREVSINAVLVDGTVHDPVARLWAPAERICANLLRLNAYLIRNSALYVFFTHAVHQTTWLQDVAVHLGPIRPNLEGIGDISHDALASSVLRLLQVAAGRDVIILVIPSRRPWVGEAARRAQAARVHEAFIDSLKTPGMNVVDMRERLEASGNPHSYHFANDGHWNEAGHRLAAEALSEALQHWD
jgi:SGNH hydrolase-like domain, acetyltransferase AlgX